MEKVKIGGYTVPVYAFDTVIVGTGASGYAAADRLLQYGQKDIAVITEGVNTGTSRNTGSDKQTYYKLTLAGNEADSVSDLAETLFAGGCVDGDTALCEAALSPQCFLRLAELGVPFPRDRFGGYIGYKTDHDPRRRATSAGPYTSKMMTERLQSAVEGAGVPVFDRMRAVKLLTDNGAACGVLCVSLSENGADGESENIGFTAFRCNNVVWATGGPAGIYADNSYPLGHFGSTGIVLEAGVRGKNLTEWQFGLSSLRPKWNVSGTYMQVLPKFISVNADGSDEKEFLYDFFSSEAEMLSKVFLKGYQWPFDVRKVKGGSSVIDLLVHFERRKGRRVFLDFRDNPGGKQVDFSALSKEAQGYLKKAGACFGTPIERLKHMNMPAVSFYRDKKVDLENERLEIALCAQHNNGGIAVDCWWRTSVKGFFAVGEAAGTHGVYRPGGSALNAGQAGAVRLSQYICANKRKTPEPSLPDCAAQSVMECISFAERVSRRESNVRGLYEKAAERMSGAGGAIRGANKLKKAIEEIKAELTALPETAGTGGVKDVPAAFRLKDTLICQLVYLEAMQNYLENNGKSRGSALYAEELNDGLSPLSDERLPCADSEVSLKHLVQEVEYSNGECKFFWREARPIPRDDDFFENVWRSYRENGNILIEGV